jgi:hypothetical protein
MVIKYDYETVSVCLDNFSDIIFSIQEFFIYSYSVILTHFRTLQPFITWHFQSYASFNPPSHLKVKYDFHQLFWSNFCSKTY